MDNNAKNDMEMQGKQSAETEGGDAETCCATEGNNPLRPLTNENGKGEKDKEEAAKSRWTPNEEGDHLGHLVPTSLSEADTNRQANAPELQSSHTSHTFPVQTFCSIPREAMSNASTSAGSRG